MVYSEEAVLSTAVGSILHGAYGDYYEQSLCLKHFAGTHPGLCLRLFFASESRMEELRVLDYGFAEHVGLWDTIPDHDIGEFHQFQGHDPELQRDVLTGLPESIVTAVTRGGRHSPWKELRTLLPLRPEQMIGLSDDGHQRMKAVMEQNGLSDHVFARPTLGVLWRYRRKGGYISPIFLPPAEQMVKKYSAVLQRLIDEFDCNVLVCGMKIKTTDENRVRTDNKFPEYGLDLPEKRCFHLKGLSWPLEMMILSRCTVCACHTSGFTEALWINRPHGVILMDPPLAYTVRLLAYRMPFFNFLSPAGFAHAVLMRHTESYLHAALRRALKQALA